MQFIDKEITYWNGEAMLYKITERQRVRVSDTGGSPRGVIIGIHAAVHTNLTLLYVPQSEWCKPGKHSLTLPARWEVDAGAGCKERQQYKLHFTFNFITCANS